MPGRCRPDSRIGRLGDDVTTSEETTRNGPKAFALAASLLMLGALLFVTLRAEPAGATGRLAATVTTTCTSYPSSACTTTSLGVTTTTVASQTTTTTSSCPPSSGAVLSVSYANNTLGWTVIGLPTSAAGTLVHLYVNGVAQGPAGTATVSAQGCTATAEDPVCLSSGVYTVAALIPGFGTPTTSLDISSAACVTTAASGTPPGSSSSSSNGGSLAFTGADIALLVVGAVFLIVLGRLLVQASRRRRAH